MFNKMIKQAYFQERIKEEQAFLYHGGSLGNFREFEVCPSLFFYSNLSSEPSTTGNKSTFDKQQNSNTPLGFASTAHIIWILLIWGFSVNLWLWLRLRLMYCISDILLFKGSTLSDLLEKGLGLKWVPEVKLPTISKMLAAELASEDGAASQRVASSDSVNDCQFSEKRATVLLHYENATVFPRNCRRARIFSLKQKESCLNVASMPLCQIPANKRTFFGGNGQQTGASKSVADTIDAGADTTSIEGDVSWEIKTSRVSKTILDFHRNRLARKTIFTGCSSGAKTLAQIRFEVYITICLF